MKLRLSPRARDDIREIGRYIRDRNPAAALAVQGAIRASFKMLETHPRAGREVAADGLRRHVVPRLPYLIFYLVDEEANALQIVTVRHTARDESE